MQPLAVIEPKLVARGAQAHSPAAELQLDVVLGVEAPVVDVDLLPFGLSTQILLGEWRTFVGALVLGADEQ